MARGRPSKKQLILDTAKRLFSERGLQGTSIDLVVQEAGVSKPTVYNNFPTKTALLEHIIRQQREELVNYLDSLKSSEWGAAEVIARAFYWVAGNSDQLALYRIWYGESHKLDDQLKGMIAEHETTLLALIHAALLPVYTKLSEEELSRLQLLCSAMARELILIPALSGKKPVKNVAEVLEAVMTRYV